MVPALPTFIMMLFFSPPDIPDRHPQCMWGPAPDPYHLHSTCTWFGAYPTPNLTWGEDQDDGSAGRKGRVYESSVADSLSLTLNRSELYDGQTLECAAQHPVLAPTDRNWCSVTLSKHVVVVK